LNGFLLRARPLMAAAAGDSGQILPVRVGVVVAEVAKAVPFSTTGGTGEPGSTITPGVYRSAADAGAAAFSAVNVAQKVTAAGVVHGEVGANSPRAGSVATSVEDGGGVASGLDGGGNCSWRRGPWWRCLGRSRRGYW